MTNKSQKKVGIALVVGALLAAGGTAFAGRLDHGPDKAAWKAKMLEKYDANKDGKLDAAEREKARAEKKAQRQERHKQMMTTFDANKDGKLDQAEKKAMREQRSAEAFKKLDTNGDGNISLAEFQAAPYAYGKGKAHGRRGQSGR